VRLLVALWPHTNTSIAKVSSGFKVFIARLGMIDMYPLEAEAFIESVIGLDWDRMIPGHPGQPGGRLGTKDDARKILALMREASAEIKKLAREGKCWQPAERDFKMPQYASWPNYENGLPYIARRYCSLWGRGT
jgi:hypothetical protein